MAAARVVSSDNMSRLQKLQNSFEISVLKPLVFLFNLSENEKCTSNLSWDSSFIICNCSTMVWLGGGQGL